MIFTSLDNVIRILSVGLLSYLGLIIILRISGNRTLSQMNSFDFVITIAMGSTFSSGLLQKSVPLFETLTALGFLVGIQFIITFISARSNKFKKLITDEPVLLFNDGNFLKKSMLKSRITQDEILGAVRSQGIDSIDMVKVVILETNGKLSTIKRSQD